MGPAWSYVPAPGPTLCDTGNGLDRMMFAMRNLAKTVAFLLAAIVLAGCADMNERLDEYSARIDAAFGVTPAARYDLMTDGDVALAAAVMQQALETKSDGDLLAWNNSESGNSGEIMPTMTFMTDLGIYCREYRETVTIGGAAGEAVNTGCRQDNGAWVWRE